jgi:hypothetical protein
MNKYHKIQTVFLRDPATKFKSLLEGQWAHPEFEYLANNEWVFTEKVDGTNIRVMYSFARGLEFGGKTDNTQIPIDLANFLNEKFNPQLEKFQDKFGDADVCLYGEGYGLKIQKGGKYRSDVSFVLFDIMINGWWLQRADVEQMGKDFNIDVVPIIGKGTLYDLIDIVSVGQTSIWGDFVAEGIVARPAIELKARNGSRIITKLKHKDFTDA